MVRPLRASTAIPEAQDRGAAHSSRRRGAGTRDAGPGAGRPPGRLSATAGRDGRREHARPRGRADGSVPSPRHGPHVQPTANADRRSGHDVIRTK
jgi:hypothetical protein